MGLAARGTRKTDSDAEQIEDEAELAQVRLQARGVNVKSGLTAVALTALSLVP